MPFDRLVRAMDDWAAANVGCEVQAQIGRGTYGPRHLVATEVLTPTEFRARVEAADVIVAHAGMGSVLTALEFGKPLVLMPRRGDLHETRNDHQVATARWLAGKPGIQIVNDGPELALALVEALAGSARPGMGSSSQRDALRSYLASVLRDANRR